MSRVVANIVLGRRFGSCSRKAVALVLADHADADEWTTVIGQERCAAESELSVRQVGRILKEFEGQGLIRRQKRFRQDGSRTSDSIVLVETAIRSLPDTMTGGQPTRPSDIERADHRTSDAFTTGQAMSEQEPSEEPSEEPSASAGARETIPDLPATRWAKEWCRIRGIQPTRAVLKSLVPQVAAYIADAGEPTLELLQAAHRRGIKVPGGWGFVAVTTPDDSDDPEWRRTFRI